MTELRGMTMNNIQKELDQAFKLVSGIPVKGEAVELMFAAKEHLRKAFSLAADKAENGEEVNTGA